MKIKRVEYENFRNFKEHGSIDCATDGRVTIIYGVNGAGKTTLHQLFRWIIYGDVKFNKTASEKMYNLEFERNAEIDSKFHVLGILDFSHADVEYSMRREWTYQKSLFETKRLSQSFTISKKNDNGDWIRLSNPQDLVEKLLPSGLSDYFFFDGESMITDLKAKSRDSANSLRSALYLMLDLDIYDRAVHYIGSTEQKTTTLGSLFLEKANISSSAELVTLGQKMDNAQSKRDDLQDQEKRYTDKINLLNDSIQRISEQIGGAKSQREYEAQRKECKRNSDLYIESAKREYASFGEEMISVFPRLMISKIIESASLQIQSCANNDQFVNGINKELIGNLLQRDTCICGNKLTEKEKEKLKSLYQFLPPIGYDELYYGFVSMANNWGKDYNREKLESYIKNALRYLELAREEDEKITKIDALMQEDKQYEKLVVERKRAEGEVEELEKRCLECHDELSKAKMLVNKLKKDIDKASSTVAANKLLDRKIAIMEAVKKYFADLLSDKSQVYSKKLEQTIQSLLNIMLEAKRTVTVSPDFSLRVLDSFDDESKSEGQFATISFAYIGGIFKLLREEEILSNKEYPLVLDAPFSKLGDAPRQKVIDTIPEYAPQIIILSKDNLQKAFGEKIGKVYTITTNTEQNVAEVKEGFLWK